MSRARSSTGSRAQTNTRTGGSGRIQRAMALVPLALLSAAWTISLTGAGPSTALAGESTTSEPTTLPDGTSVPTEAIRAPASVSTGKGIAPAIHGNARDAVATASASGIPSAALAAYQRAETVINAADKSCHLPWQLVAAIGRVESDHGRTNGNRLDGKGVARPGIYGIPLDGHHGTTRISDTDAGQYDSDAKWDRAVGPMQFIPSTWSVVGVDADNDGKRNPQDIDDAALATAVYLCSGDDDLSTSSGQRHATYRYNHSSAYVDLVLSIMRAYMRGDFTSVPNSTTSASYLVPAPEPKHHAPRGPKHPQPAPPPVSTGGGGGGGTGSHSQPAPQPAPEPEPTVEPSPTSVPTSDGGGLLGGGGSGGGGVKPSTGSSPVDQTLSLVEAKAQCLAEGLLAGTASFDKCVFDYTH